MSMPSIRLKKQGDRRVRFGHPWVYSNEIDVNATPLLSFQPGEEVRVESHDGRFIGKAYVNPHSLISLRLFSRQKTDTLNTDFFLAKLKNALALRESLFGKPYYRMVYSEADRLPGLIIDRFDNHLVCQLNTAGMEVRQAMLADALKALLPKVSSVLLRNDSPVRAHENLPQYVQPLYGNPPEAVLLEENALKFYAPLSIGQKTGWFYDHRNNRARLKTYAQDKKVLDVFSYLGAFGIQAAGAGAALVDCIEESQFAADYIVKNAALNNLSHKVNVLKVDAFEGLRSLLAQEKQYDIIVLDPPAFVKKNKDLKHGTIAYQRINELAFKLLSPNGLLVSCSCSMPIQMADLFAIIGRAAARSKISGQILEQGHQGPDHPILTAMPEMNYLKAIFVKKSQGDIEGLSSTS